MFRLESRMRRMSAAQGRWVSRLSADAGWRFSVPLSKVQANHLSRPQKYQTDDGRTLDPSHVPRLPVTTDRARLALRTISRAYPHESSGASPSMREAHYQSTKVAPASFTSR